MLRIEEIETTIDDDFRELLHGLADSDLEVLLEDSARLRRVRPVGVSSQEARQYVRDVMDFRRRKAEQAARREAERLARNERRRAQRAEARRRAKEEAAAPPPAVFFPVIWLPPVTRADEPEVMEAVFEPETDVPAAPEPEPALSAAEPVPEAAPPAPMPPSARFRLWPFAVAAVMVAAAALLA